MEEKKETEVEVVDEPEMKRTVIEAKEGIMGTVKKHWKKIAAGAAIVGTVVICKVIGNRKKTDYDLDDSGDANDFDEFDIDDEDVVDSPTE